MNQLPTFLDFVKKWIRPDRPARPQYGPRIYTRSEHPIASAQISPRAVKVVQELHRAGFQAYLVGGCVRDLLLGRTPKDFDVATAAHPEQVKAIFRNCRLIGRRFRLAHVYFGQEVVEVATFRGGVENGNGERRLSNGRLVADNVYGTLEEDAFRRDFTVNAMYYDPREMTVIDYLGGMADIEHGVLRLIGDPEARYREDPVRMLRAARFAAKLGFTIDPASEAPIHRLAPLLRDIPPARLYDETLKLFLTGHALRTFDELRRHELFGVLFPLAERALHSHGEEVASPLSFVVRALENTDLRLAEGKPVTPYFLYAALLWEPVRERCAELVADGAHIGIAMQDAASDVLNEQARHTAFPRAVSMPMREVWLMQPRFHQCSGIRPFRLMEQPRFRAAYDFLLLRAASGEDCDDLSQWWTAFLEADEAGRRSLARPTKQAEGRRRRHKRKPRPAGGETAE